MQLLYLCCRWQDVTCHIMKTEQYDIKTNIKIGQEIFDNIPNEIKPGWAGLVLSRFDQYLKAIPTSILELYPIIDDEDRWKEAYEQFTKIRRFGLENKNYEPENYLRLAELVAKVTYNASGQSAPFDSDSGYYIASLALKATEYFDDNRLEEEVKSAILLFGRNKYFMDNFTAAKDFLLYKKIDNILWFNWDPIGINEIAPRDEYQSYTPTIFKLKTNGANRETIAKALHEIETATIGVVGDIDHCRQVADKIIYL